jgi:uncharacterized membrane protein YfcA
MLLLASLLSLLVGVSLAVMGGGGSILTVPILRYVLGLRAHEAIAISMLVVCTTSLAALIPHARGKRVNWQVGVTFGLAGMLGAFVTGRLTRFVPALLLLLGFALLMFATAFSMLRKPKALQRTAAAPGAMALPKILAEGVAVGAVTGLLGAGGGFVVVPALVLLAKLPMDVAVGTSLVVVAMNTAAGFLGMTGQLAVDSRLALMLSTAAVLGSSIGGAVAGSISPAALKRSFGWFVIATAWFIVAQELPRLMGYAPSISVALLVSCGGTLLCAGLAHASARTQALSSRTRLQQAELTQPPPERDPADA